MATGKKKTNAKLMPFVNGKSIDWLIFSNILNQNFQSFEIFGISINNSNLISKLLSISLILFLGFSRL